MFNLFRARFSTLVVAEHSAGRLSGNTRKVLSAARELNEPTDVVICGNDLTSVLADLQEKSCQDCVRKVFVADHSLLADMMADRLSLVVESLVKTQGYEQVMMSGSSQGKDLLPYLAGLLGTQPVTEVTQVVGKGQYVRPIYAGNAMASVSSGQAVDCLTIRATSFEDNVISCETKVSEVEQVSVESVL